MTRNIFVIGLEAFNLALLEKVRRAEDCAFHGLLDFHAVAQDPDARVDDLLAQAFAQLDAFPGSIDAVVGYWDFPTILMAPIIRRRYGLPGPSLESVLRCEHKYWARRIQRDAAPEMVPDFALVDPFAADAADSPPLPYPFWIKPVKAHSSMLGYRVDGPEAYRDALAGIRGGIERFAVNLNQIMARADPPAEIAAADGWKCIAETLISQGRQCTLEGYVFRGEPRVYGVVDSIRGPNRSSFARYQYPSTLPGSVQRRMIEATEQFVIRTGLDDSPFNIEFYWNSRTDRLSVLEINARISKSHSPLFEKVEGAPHKQVMIDVALGRRPDFPLGRGVWRHAAKFMLRRYDCGGEDIVVAAPSDAELRAIEADFPGCDIELHVSEGMRLKDLHFQDSYSHELADIFVGANSQRAMMETYRAIKDRLDIRIETPS